jgi:type IV pilus assembly protein PilC
MTSIDSPKPQSEKLEFIKNLGITREKDFIIENLSMLLASGMPVGTALLSIQKAISSDRLRYVLKRMQDEIDGGSPLWKAMDNTHLFSAHSIALVRVGEQSGKLSDNLKIILEQQQRDRTLKSKVRSAMIYPAIVLFLTLVVALGSAWFVLPRLATAFSSLDVELPLSTRIIIASGSFLQNHGTFVIPLIILLLGVVFYFLFISKKTKPFFERVIFFRIPVIHKIIQEIELARAGFIIGSLLSAGVAVVETLALTSEVTESTAYKKLFNTLALSIGDGNSFEKSFSQIEGIGSLVPLTVQQLIISGEQSGTLPEVFYKVGEIYSQKTESTTRDLSSILEPVLLIGVSIGVFFIAIGIISPVYNLIGDISSPSVDKSQNRDDSGASGTNIPFGVTPAAEVATTSATITP